MQIPLMLLKFVGKAAANMVGGGIAGDLLFEVIPEVAADAYKWWKKERTPEEQARDLALIAQAPPEEVKLQVKEVVQEVAADKPPEVKRELEIFLSLIPGQVRRSLRRPSDPQGTTAGLAQVPQKPDDMIPLMPSHLPKFKPGDRPLPGVDLELDELLGVGGFGEVWKARNPLLDGVDPVALKFCLDPQAGQFLKNEAAVLNRVMRQGRHPNIVRLERTYFSAETPCLEYEYIEGGDLAGLIREWHAAQPRPSLLEITCEFAKVAAAVGHAHSQTPPIVHRDLKPANVLRQLLPDGTCVLKVADFGIGGVASKQAIEDDRSRAVSRGAKSMLLVSQLNGSCTPLYASPQQKRGDGPDPRDDVFALGVMWYQMVTGDLTAERPGGMRWGQRLTDQGLDQKLVGLMAECFEDNLEDRLPSAAELSRRLAELLPDCAPAPAAKSPPPPAAPAPVSQPSPRPLMPVKPLPPELRRPDVAEAQSAREDDLRHRLEKMEVVLEANDSDARAWAERGEIHRQLGKNDEAIHDCTQAILLDASLAVAYATRGGAYRMKREWDMTISDCTQAIQLDPKNVMAYYQRGEAHRIKARHDKAIADASEAIKLDAKYYWAWAARGAAYQAKGDYQKAIEDLDEALRLEPRYAWALAVRGETHRMKGDYDQAIRDCTEALKVRSDFVQALATRGAAFRQKGDFATALKDLNLAIRLEPQNQFARDQQFNAERRRK